MLALPCQKGTIYHHSKNLPKYGQITGLKILQPAHSHKRVFCSVFRIWKLNILKLPSELHHLYSQEASTRQILLYSSFFCLLGRVVALNTGTECRKTVSFHRAGTLESIKKEEATTLGGSKRLLQEPQDREKQNRWGTEDSKRA